MGALTASSAVDAKGESADFPLVVQIFESHSILTVEDLALAGSGDVLPSEVVDEILKGKDTRFENHLETLFRLARSGMKAGMELWAGVVFPKLALVESSQSSTPCTLLIPPSSSTAPLLRRLTRIALSSSSSSQTIVVDLPSLSLAGAEEKSQKSSLTLFHSSTRSWCGMPSLRSLPQREQPRQAEFDRVPDCRLQRFPPVTSGPIGGTQTC